MSRPDYAELSAYKPNILPLRRQAEIQNDWLKRRLDTVLPELMAREDADMWVLIAREGNEDPTAMTFLPSPRLSARRRTIIVFHRTPDGSVDRMILSRYSPGPYYRSIWHPDDEDVWERLALVISERNPRTIHINVSEDYPLADGLSHNEHENLNSCLDPRYRERLCSGERLAVGWLERRLPEEIATYSHIAGLAHAVIATGFSPRVIHPGVTTTDDVVWWFREAIRDLGLAAWFQPTVSLQAPGQGPMEPGDTGEDRRTVILPGDVLHCDVGLEYLGLATDTQQMAYVLRPGEEDAPAGLRAALATGNRTQEIITGEFRVGRTGNEMLESCKEKAGSLDIDATFYTHPVGFHGHGAGIAIGMWDKQGGVPGMGDYPLYGDTCYAIEFNIKQAVPEWGNQPVMIGLEQNAAFTRGACHWLDRIQTRFHLI